LTSPTLRHNNMNVAQGALLNATPINVSASPLKGVSQTKDALTEGSKAESEQRFEHDLDTVAMNIQKKLESQVADFQGTKGAAASDPTDHFSNL